MSELQKEIYDRLSAKMRDNHESVATKVRPLGAEEIMRKPAPTEWSVAEVLEHLTLMDALFLTAIEPLIRDARADAGAPNRPYRESFIGKKIAESLTKPKKLKSPKVAVPIMPRAGVAEVFLAGDARFLELIESARALDWNALRLRPPPAPWLPLRLNLGDAFHIHTVHVTRHLEQIRRVTSAI